MAENQSQIDAENQSQIDPRSLKEAEELITEVVKRTGIRRKVIWEELRYSLFYTLDVAIKNIKAIPAIGAVAYLIEKPVENLRQKAASRKSTRTEEWQSVLQKEIRQILNEEYISRSAQELKNSSSQSAQTYIEAIATAATAAIYNDARKISNIITIGISGAVAGSTTAISPWVLPIAGVATAMTVIHQRYVNKKQIKINIEKKQKHTTAQASLKNQQTAVLENSERYASIQGFARVMSDKLAECSDSEIDANIQKLNAIYKNSKDNNNISAFWGSLPIIAAFGIAYAESGLGGVMSNGLAVAAAASTCFAMASEAINCYINTGLEVQQASGLCAKLLQKFRAKHKDFDRGQTRANPLDNVIVLSNDLSYQHRDYSVDGAPLSGKDLFRSDHEIVIGKGVTILSGASGTGKTTLTTLLTQGAYATTGSIQLGHFEQGQFVGTDYKDLESISSNIAVAFQSTPKVSVLSVDDYIMLENPRADKKKVQEVKELLGIGDKSKAGTIDENAPVSTISDGQKRRIELARALIKDSPIMILDEPTSGVDETMSRNIVSYLKELSKEKTIVYITHDAREIEQIGAYQAIDIDKTHSQDEQNTIRTYSLSNDEKRKAFVTMFAFRKKEEEQAKEQKQGMPKPPSQYDVDDHLTSVRSRLSTTLQEITPVNESAKNSPKIPFVKSYLKEI